MNSQLSASLQSYDKCKCYWGFCCFKKMSSPIFMRDPPEGQNRWDKSSFASTQQAVGAATFTLATVVFGLRIFTRLSLTKVGLRIDDCKSSSRFRSQVLQTFKSIEMALLTITSEDLCGASLVSCWAFYGCTIGSKNPPFLVVQVSTHSAQQLEPSDS